MLCDSNVEAVRVSGETNARELAECGDEFGIIKIEFRRWESFEFAIEIGDTNCPTAGGTIRDCPRLRARDPEELLTVLTTKLDRHGYLIPGKGVSPHSDDPADPLPV